ncbi:helix-turn-helix domain-containing protein [Flavobacterium sp.]|uniref:winged helix-turn-helix transcriptional regulator n=1 Tax=Flavobacterium sp. TaxID=239 RepID=UPI0025BE9860|nr:helix-turn-helix domain-containing protein [Flavobacterium sp.]
MKYENLINSEDQILMDRDVCFKSILNMMDTLDVVSGKWKIPIIMSLSFGPKRFSLISKDLKKISDRALAKELKLLEENLLIERQANISNPLVIEYAITEHGMSLSQILNSLKKWGLLHRKVLSDAINKPKQNLNRFY